MDQLPVSMAAQAPGPTPALQRHVHSDSHQGTAHRPSVKPWGWAPLTVPPDFIDCSITASMGRGTGVRPDRAPRG